MKGFLFIASIIVVELLLGNGLLGPAVADFVDYYSFHILIIAALTYVSYVYAMKGKSSDAKGAVVGLATVIIFVVVVVLALTWAFSGGFSW